MLDTREIVTWLIEGVPAGATPMVVLGKVAEDLRKLGVRVDQAEAFVRTLHPHIAGRSFEWRPGVPVTVQERSYAYLQSPEFLVSSIAAVFSSGTSLRRRANDPAECGYLDSIGKQGYRDLLVTPLKFISGETHAVAWASSHEEGFTTQCLEAIAAIMPALSRVGEILALSRTAVNLLNTYVGRDAGERILSGKIQRGDIDSIRAVIWFSDLRGFTSISSALTPGEVIRMLNAVFECQVGAIEAQGGEVLKFIGDGLLAIFPVDDQEGKLAEATACALKAADAAFAALEALNRSGVDGIAAQLRCGIALHIGEIAYGNIGGSGRLDFTCIGQAVNLAARLEGIASKMSEPLVFSDAVARQALRPTRSLGSFELKGVPDKQEVFAPEASGAPIIG